MTCVNPPKLAPARRRLRGNDLDDATKQALRAAARAAATAAGHESAQSSDSEPDAAAAAASSTAAASAAASRVRGRSIDERLSQEAGYHGEPVTPSARESAHQDTPDDYAPDDLTGMSVVRARRPQRAADGESESELTLTRTRARTRTRTRTRTLRLTVTRGRSALGATPGRRCRGGRR